MNEWECSAFFNQFNELRPIRSKSSSKQLLFQVFGGRPICFFFPPNRLPNITFFGIRHNQASFFTCPTHLRRCLITYLSIGSVFVTLCSSRLCISSRFLPTICRSILLFTVFSRLYSLSVHVHVSYPYRIVDKTIALYIFTFVSRLIVL